MPISADKLPPAKFSPEQQAQNPDAKMTRVVKDFLKVGKWTCGTNHGHAEDWDITADQLTLAAKTFRQLRENGHKPKLYWGNFRSDVNSQHEVATQDEITEIDDVIVDGEEAYLLAYVSPAEAKRLENSSLEVSPQIATEWTDSKKRRYENALMHVAIVDHPVILGQGKFLTLSADGKKNSTARVLTLANELSDSGSHDKGNADMTLLEKLKAKFSLGDDVTADNIDAKIEAKLNAKTTPTTDPTVTPGASADVKQLAAMVEKQGSTILHLSNELTKLLTKERQSEADAYNAELDRLFKAGNINAAMKNHLAKIGEPHRYDLAMLAPFAVVKSLAATKSNTLELATPDEPDLGGGETDEARDKRLKEAGYTPLRTITA